MESREKYCELMRFLQSLTALVMRSSRVTPPSSSTITTAASTSAELLDAMPSRAAAEAKAALEQIGASASLIDEYIATSALTKGWSRGSALVSGGAGAVPPLSPLTKEQLEQKHATSYNKRDVAEVSCYSFLNKIDKNWFLDDDNFSSVMIEFGRCSFRGLL